jgi:P-type E1-E2 ATPase
VQNLALLIKNAEAIEKMDKMDVLITDKTGTITEGKPSVEKIVVKEIDENDCFGKNCFPQSKQRTSISDSSCNVYAKSKNSNFI